MRGQGDGARNGSLGRFAPSAQGAAYRHVRRRGRAADGRRRRGAGAHRAAEAGGGGSARGAGRSSADRRKFRSDGYGVGNSRSGQCRLSNPRASKPHAGKSGHRRRLRHLDAAGRHHHEQRLRCHGEGRRGRGFDDGQRGGGRRDRRRQRGEGCRRRRGRRCHQAARLRLRQRSRAMHARRERRSRLPRGGGEFVPCPRLCHRHQRRLRDVGKVSAGLSALEPRAARRASARWSTSSPAPCADRPGTDRRQRPSCSRASPAAVASGEALRDQLTRAALRNSQRRPEPPRAA